MGGAGSAGGAGGGGGGGAHGHHDAGPLRSTRAPRAARARAHAGRRSRCSRSRAQHRTAPYSVSCPARPVPARDLALVKPYRDSPIVTVAARWRFDTLAWRALGGRDFAHCRKRACNVINVRISPPMFAFVINAAVLPQMFDTATGTVAALPSDRRAAAAPQVCGATANNTQRKPPACPHIFTASSASLRRGGRCACSTSP